MYGEKRRKRRSKEKIKLGNGGSHRWAAVPSHLPQLSAFHSAMLAEQPWEVPEPEKLEENLV